METLIIQPVEYRGKRLNELGERIIAVFEPIFSGYTINGMLEAKDLKEILITPEGHAAHDTPWISGPEFPEYLHRYGAPIIGITSLPATRDVNTKDINKGWIYGGFTEKLRSGFVSTYRPEFGEIDKDMHIERLVIEAIHELAHGRGLDHHDKEIKTKSGRYCPMTDQQDKVLKGEITWADYISARDPYSFCEKCSRKLHPQPNKYIKFFENLAANITS